FFFSSRRRHTRSLRDWSSDVCSSDLTGPTSWLCLSSISNGDGGMHVGRRPNPDDIDVRQSHEVGPVSDGHSGWNIFLAKLFRARSEERRVGKESRYRWWAGTDRQEDR